MKPTKRCPKCGIEKPHDAFSKNKASRDGLQSSCKPCRKVLIRNWREKNAEQAKRYFENYRKTHREERRAYDRQWRKQHPEYWRSYQNERLQTDIEYRLRNYIGAAIRRAIRKNRRSTFDILGYSVEELCQHLEALFQQGMSWQNYGTHWHIDHVVPKSWFQLHNENGIDEVEFKLCWSLQNLQPMWMKENLEKKNQHISHIKLGQSPTTYSQFRTLMETAKRNQSALML